MTEKLLLDLQNKFNIKMKNIKIITTESFNKKIQKLERKNSYSFDKFDKDIDFFLENENNTKFRKNKLSWKKDIFSISLWYDLRALYFFVRKKEDWLIEYVFFDIWNHDEVY